MHRKRSIARRWQWILTQVIGLSAAAGMWLTVVAAEDLLQGLPQVHTDVCREEASRVTNTFCAMESARILLDRPDDEDLVVRVLVADTPQTRAAGYQFIHPDIMARSGIFFVFNRESTGAFHMCNVAAPIDILWFRPDGRVLDAQRMMPGPARSASLCRQLYAPSNFGTYLYALELPAGVLQMKGLDVKDTRGWRLNVDPLFQNETESTLSNRLPSISLEEVVSGLTQPLQVTYAPGDDASLFVVEKIGRIRVVRDGRLEPTPLLDLRGSLSTGFEQGLLSLAFHPEFADNGYVFVNLTNRQGDTEVLRYTVDRRNYQADPASQRVLLTIPQPAANHNGGMMAFDPDGYLYVGTGDGGRAGDPWNNAQSLDTLLGKMLRLDVDVPDGYAVPTDNPFASQRGVRGEIWAYGLRNPWRFSFDRESGDLVIADVGQRNWEEINLQPSESRGGENYGWNRMEGNHCYPTGSRCDDEGLTLPIYEYSHEQTGGCSITGGYVYRGRDVPTLKGWYVFGDYCSGTVWALERMAQDEGTEPRFIELLQTSFQISSFGEDAQGELYIADLRSGRILKIQQ